MLAEAETRSAAIQQACEHYLREEREIKEKLKKLEADLYNERIGRATDIRDLKSQIQDWEFKYTQDVEEVQ